MQRNELVIRASAVGLDPTTIPNDSKLEQKVLYLEKRQVAVSGVVPTTTLTSTGTAADGETATIGTRVYTFKTALTGAANEVLIGAAATNTLDNLKDAINGTSVSGNPGTIYGTGTKPHEDFTAGTKTATTLIISSRDSSVGNSAATTETMTNFSFTGATASAGTRGAIAGVNSPTMGGNGISGDKNVT